MIVLAWLLLSAYPSPAVSEAAYNVHADTFYNPGYATCYFAPGHVIRASGHDILTDSWDKARPPWKHFPWSSGERLFYRHFERPGHYLVAVPWSGDLRESIHFHWREAAFRDQTNKEAGWHECVGTEL
ncbi:hypothetical protein PYCC9005_002915 [Savitreella phatthalungensis]